MSDPGILDEAVTAAATGTGVGGGFFALRWLVQWLSGRLDKRQAQLDAEHGALDMSWKEYRLLLERDRQDLRAQVRQIVEQNRALRLAFEHVAGALIRINPRHESLVIADKILTAAFPTDMSLGVAMASAALDEDERRRMEQ